MLSRERNLYPCSSDFPPAAPYLCSLRRCSHSVGASAIRSESYLNGFSVLWSFDFVVDFTIFDAFHGLQACAGLEVFLCGSADCVRQRIVVYACFVAQNLAVRVGNQELDVFTGDC